MSRFDQPHFIGDRQDRARPLHCSAHGPGATRDPERPPLVDRHSDLPVPHRRHPFYTDRPWPVAYPVDACDKEA